MKIDKMQRRFLPLSLPQTGLYPVIRHLTEKRKSIGFSEFFQTLHNAIIRHFMYIQQFKSSLPRQEKQEKTLRFPLLFLLSRFVLL